MQNGECTAQCAFLFLFAKSQRWTGYSVASDVETKADADFSARPPLISWEFSSEFRVVTSMVQQRRSSKYSVFLFCLTENDSSCRILGVFPYSKRFCTRYALFSRWQIARGNVFHAIFARGSSAVINALEKGFHHRDFLRFSYMCWLGSNSKNLTVQFVHDCRVCGGLI